MKKITILLIATIGLFLFSCNSNSNEKSNDSTGTKALKLNNGEKWKVNDAMIPFIKNMETDINDFSTSAEKDYKLLSEKLQKNIDKLISSCTMRGEAHDELHKWLLPYIAFVKELSSANSDTEAAKQFENIQNSFNTFNQYFQ